MPWGSRAESKEPKWNSEKATGGSAQLSMGERWCACPSMGSGKAVLRLARSSQSSLCPRQDPEPVSGLRDEEGGGERERLKTSNVLAVSLTFKCGAEVESHALSL